MVYTLGKNKEHIIAGLKMLMETIEKSPKILSSTMELRAKTGEFCNHTIKSGAEIFQFEVVLVPLCNTILKPCPFCGCADISLMDDNIQIKCSHCGACGSSWDANIEDAIRNWNSRI